MAIKDFTVKLNLPFGIGGVQFKVTEEQRKAAWALYVEMATRVSTQELDPESGSIREALNSLYSLFDTTRSVLKSSGPDVARGANSFGPLAIRVLNEGLRPFLTEWHTDFSAFENEQPRKQKAYPREKEFYEKLNELRRGLLEYVDQLAEIAGVHAAHKDED